VNPCFFSLYRRGNYFKQWVEEEKLSGKIKKTRERKLEERERFAMAAIAFCLKYGPQFRVNTEA